MPSNSYTHPLGTPASVPASFHRYQAGEQKVLILLTTGYQGILVQRQNRRSGNLLASYSVHYPADAHSSAEYPAFAARTW